MSRGRQPESDLAGFVHPARRTSAAALRAAPPPAPAAAAACALCLTVASAPCAVGPRRPTAASARPDAGPPFSARPRRRSGGAHRRHSCRRGSRPPRRRRRPYPGPGTPLRPRRRSSAAPTTASSRRSPRRPRRRRPRRHRRLPLGRRRPGWRCPVQVDQRFPNLPGQRPQPTSASTRAPTRSSPTPGTPTAHAVGEEAWKKVAGQCSARYPSPGRGPPPRRPAHHARHGRGADRRLDPCHGRPRPDASTRRRGGARRRPGRPRRPRSARPAPAGVDPASARPSSVVDPHHRHHRPPSTCSSDRAARRSPPPPARCSCTAGRERRPLDRPRHASPTAPRGLGISNTGYGPNLAGTVCDDGTPVSSRTSTDRFPRDGQARLHAHLPETATGRWMVRGLPGHRPRRRRGATAPT